MPISTAQPPCGRPVPRRWRRSCSSSATASPPCSWTRPCVLPKPARLRRSPMTPARNPSPMPRHSPQERYPGLTDHPFPTCFSCGTQRDPDDALCLRPGPVADSAFAAAWVPREVTSEIVWSALDCPGGWALGVGGRPMVLGTMTTQISELPAVGAECVVMSWRTGGEGRKHTAGTALYSGGQLLAQARSVWLEVDPEKVRPA